METLFLTSRADQGAVVDAWDQGHGDSIGDVCDEG